VAKVVSPKPSNLVELRPLSRYRVWIHEMTKQILVDAVSVSRGKTAVEFFGRDGKVALSVELDSLVAYKLEKR
jgi:hypothetical protein